MSSSCELQGHIVGTWTYQNGSSYRVVLDGDNFVFEERHGDGRDVRGILLQEDAWLVGRLIYRDTSEVSGTVMLQFADGLDTLTSFFQPRGTSGWVQAVATRSGKAQARILDGKGQRPLPTSLMQSQRSFLTQGPLSVTGYPEVSREEFGWSPILCDCVLQSLKARVAYLEETMSSHHSEATVRGSNYRCLPERGDWRDMSLRVQPVKAKTLARTIWSEADACQELSFPTLGKVQAEPAPPDKGQRRISKKDQAVQCVEEKPPVAPASPVAPSVLAPPAPSAPAAAPVEPPEKSCHCGSKTRRNVHLQAVLERQNRRCLVLAEDVAVLSEELGKIRSQPFTATGLLVSSSVGGDGK